MEDKYYIPKESEFHIGFECEYYSNHCEKYLPIIIDSSNFELNSMDGSFDDDYVLSYNYSKPNKFRVKYLDKEDMESLGFKKSNKNSWCGYKDYFLENINPEYPYFLFATIHVPIRDDMYKILVHRYYNEDESIDEDDNYREPTTVFVGKIKNKSELNQLLKRLNIINE